MKNGKTPVRTAAEGRGLFDGIDTATVVGLRDRALVALMVYSFARVSAAVGVRVEDYAQRGKRCWLRLHKKGGKHHEVPAHHYVIGYLGAAAIGADRKSPLFRTVDRQGELTARRMTTRNVTLRMIKRRARKAHTAASVDLTALPLVGLGSVCRCQATRSAELLIRDLCGAGGGFTGWVRTQARRVGPRRAVAGVGRLAGVELCRPVGRAACRVPAPVVPELSAVRPRVAGARPPARVTGRASSARSPAARRSCGTGL